MRSKIFALGLAVCLAASTGCASVKSMMGWLPTEAETAAQGYFESYSYWLVLKETAVEWAESPAGQARPEILDEFVKLDIQVQIVLDEIAALFCLAEAPTPDDPAPPPLPGCVPVTDFEAESAYETATDVIRLSSAELRRYLVAEGVTR